MLKNNVVGMKQPEAQHVGFAGLKNTKQRATRNIGKDRNIPSPAQKALTEAGRLFFRIFSRGGPPRYRNGES